MLHQSSPDLECFTNPPLKYMFTKPEDSSTAPFILDNATFSNQLLPNHHQLYISPKETGINIIPFPSLTSFDYVNKFPNKFVRQHGYELYDTVRLSIPTGCCWDVKVKKDGDGTIWLHDGFFEFMEENSIGIGYFLIFKYEGNSKFGVHIFDLTATEIMYNRRSDSERCAVNELQRDETREVRDDSFKYESGNKDSDDSTKHSLKNETVYEVSADDMDDSSKYESSDEDTDDDDGKKASDDRADNSLNNESVDKVSDDDINGSFMSESSDEADDDGDDYIYERKDKDFNNGGVDPPKYENGNENSGDSSIRCLGSTIDPLSPQLFAESSEFASKNKKNAGASPETIRARRCYLTRSKTQITEGRLDTNGSMRRGPGSNSSPRDIATKTTTRAKKIKPLAPNSFRVTLKPYHITNGMLRLPCSFARSYMSSSTAAMKLLDADNKEWEIVYVHPVYREHDYVLSKGWKKFVNAKGLMVGDICVFEHIEGTKEVTLKVNIIRNLD